MICLWGKHGCLSQNCTIRKLMDMKPVLHALLSKLCPSIECPVNHMLLTDMLLIDKVLIFILHYNDVTWASRKLKPPATWLFVGQHVQADNISIMKTVHYLLFVWLVDPFHKGQVIWKAFSCHDIIMVICRPWVSHQGLYMLNAIFADLQVCSEIPLDKVRNEIIKNKITASRNICEAIFISEKVWVLPDKKHYFRKFPFWTFLILLDIDLSCISVNEHSFSMSFQ